MSNMAPSSSQSSSKNIKPEGITVLQRPDKPNVDILLVHGLTGHPETTWTSGKTDVQQGADEPVERPSKMRRLKKNLKKPRRLPHVYWPQELLPKDFPNARIMTYGFLPHIVSPWNRSLSNDKSVYDIAQDILHWLAGERGPNCSRPVIFISHSLGGLITKRALMLAKDSQSDRPHFYDVFVSTIGIIFFGTPHRGADPRGLCSGVALALLESIGGAFQPQVIDHILPESDQLKQLLREFVRIAGEKKWTIYSFQEEKNLRILGRKVVDDWSSSLDIRYETALSIARDHREMCRFTSRNDVEYKRVVIALNQMTSAISDPPKEVQARSLSVKQKTALIDSLYFSEMTSLRLMNRHPHDGTWKWILGTLEYLDWISANKMNQNFGLLWLKGKPVSGKSTLMKYIFNHYREVSDRIAISFVFHDRGTDLARSPIGMYRSLLQQLLEECPRLQKVLNNIGLPSCHDFRNHEWSVEALKGLIEQAVLGLGRTPVWCFIDAVDKCDMDQIEDMVKFFNDLASSVVAAKVEFRVLFAARHYPLIRLTKGLKLILQEQKGHSDAIAGYIQSNLDIGDSVRANKIRGDVLQKSSKVFMWVCLVVRMLNEGYLDGGCTQIDETLSRLEKRLERTPEKFDELFHEILTRDHGRRDKLLLCIQWILFKREPLNPKQLFFAINAGTEKNTLAKWDTEDLPENDIVDSLTKSSKGLVEVEDRKVRFIHEWVTDYLVEKNGLRKVWPDLGDNLGGYSHDRLKSCCLRYLESDAVRNYDINDPNGRIKYDIDKGQLPKANTQYENGSHRERAAESFPFLKYAISNILYHADAAEANRVSQEIFLDNFPPRRWLGFYNLFEESQDRRLVSPTLLYILAKHGSSALVRSFPQAKSCFAVERAERYGTPFFAALAAGTEQVAQILLEIEAEKHPELPQLQTLCQQNLNRPQEQRMALRIGFRFMTGRSLLSYAAQHGDALYASFILYACDSNVKARDKNKTDDWTPVMWAAAQGHKHVVELLVAVGGSDIIDARDVKGRTPLSLAAENGHEPVVKQLLEFKPTAVYTEDNKGVTPVSYATRGGHENVVSLLRTGVVETQLPLGRCKVEISDYPDIRGYTPLSYAMDGGHEAGQHMLSAHVSTVKEENADF